MFIYLSEYSIIYNMTYIETRLTCIFEIKKAFVEVAF